jgi:RNA polymerase sigma-70 factor (ECF subfamily)
LMGREGRSGRDEGGFDVLFDAHYAELRRYATRRVENRAAIEDVLAETFATAWRRREQMPETALPWLFGVCHNVIANHRRSVKRRSRLLSRLASSRTDLGRDPAESLAERSEITRAFTELSDSQREVLRLIAWDGLSASEAAAVLGCTPAAFRVRLHRARSELAKHLGEAGHEPNETPGGREPREGYQEAQ